MAAQIIVNGKFLGDPLTGVQRHAWEITSRLLPEQPNIKIAVPRSLAVAPAYQPLDERSLYRIGQGSGHYWQQRRLPKGLQRHDLLWTPSGLGPLLVRRQVLTVHDLSFLDHPEWFSKSYGLVYRTLLPLAMKRALHIFTSSEFSKQRIIDRLQIPAARISVIHSAVSSAIVSTTPSTAGAATITEQYGLPKRYILALGSIEPRKNLTRLIEAALLLQPAYPDLRVVLVGSKNTIYGQVHFPPEAERIIQPLGYVPNHHLQAIYGQAQVFVYPSLYEGFGIPPLEAMACGTPVITSNGTSLPEVVGDAALLIPPTDSSALSAAIRRILDDPALRDRLIAAGYRRVARFSWDVSARKVADILQHLATLNQHTV